MVALARLPTSCWCPPRLLSGVRRPPPSILSPPPHLSWVRKAAVGPLSQRNHPLVSSRALQAVGYGADGPSSLVLLLADIQSFRDVFRAVFLPGVAIITFTLPAVLLGLLLRAIRGFTSADGAKDTGRSQMLTALPPPPAMNEQTAILALKLLASIVIDLIGDGSFLIPGAGEGTDFLWAPISALLIRYLYRSNVLSAVAFLEELLPFTDVLPTATLAFVFEVLFSEPGGAGQQDQQQQQQGRRPETGPVIDVAGR